MRRFLAAAAAAAVISGSTAAQAAVQVRHLGAPVRALAPTVSVSGWAPSGTGALSVAKVGDMGAVPATMPMHIAVGLAMQNASAEAATLKALYTPGSPQYRQFLTPAQFTAEFGANPATANAVASYLASAGLTNVTIAPNRLLVTADGNASTVSAAFQTNIHAVEYGGAARYVNVTPAMVPAQLAGAVVGVLGLNNIPQQTNHVIASSAAQHKLRTRSVRSLSRRFAEASTGSTFSCTGLISAGGVCGGMELTPTELRVAYNDRGNPTASNTNVGIFTFLGIDGIINDLRIMEYRNGLRQVPVNVVYVNGGRTPGVGDPEWDLDTQASTGIAGDVNSLTIFNTADGSDWGTTVMYNKWVTDDKVQVTSASYGECEAFAYVDGAMHPDDQIFFEGAVQGQSIFNSSGDTGSSCYNPFVPLPVSPNGTPEGVQGGVQYPTSSPFVVSVGGTDLLVNAADGTYNTETGWQTGGGGMSAFEVFFEYQLTPYSQLNRMVPDISMTADPNVGDGMDTIVAGSDLGVGGTSLSSPLAAGVFARLLSRHNNQLGNALQDFYFSYGAWGGWGPTTGTQNLFPIPTPGTTYTQVGGFKDLLAGDNGLFSCLPGYDMVTGLGSLDINGQIVGWGS